MTDEQLQADHAAVRETYWQEGKLYRWRVDLANGSALTGEILFDLSKGEEELKDLCRVDAEAMLQSFLGLDSTTLVHEKDLSRQLQISQYEFDVLTAEARLINLKQGITTGVFIEAEELSIEEQIQQLESYKTVLIRKLNRMKL